MLLSRSPRTHNTVRKMCGRSRYGRSVQHLVVRVTKYAGNRARKMCSHGRKIKGIRSSHSTPCRASSSVQVSYSIKVYTFEQIVSIFERHQHQRSSTFLASHDGRPGTNHMLFRYHHICALFGAALLRSSCVTRA